jgi:hypothetical protein
MPSSKGSSTYTSLGATFPYSKSQPPRGSSNQNASHATRNVTRLSSGEQVWTAHTLSPSSYPDCSSDSPRLGLSAPCHPHPPVLGSSSPRASSRAASHSAAPPRSPIRAGPTAAAPRPRLAARRPSLTAAAPSRRSSHRAPVCGCVRGEWEAPLVLCRAGLWRCSSYWSTARRKVIGAHAVTVLGMALLPLPPLDCMKVACLEANATLDRDATPSRSTTVLGDAAHAAVSLMFFAPVYTCVCAATYPRRCAGLPPHPESVPFPSHPSQWLVQALPAVRWLTQGLHLFPREDDERDCRACRQIPLLMRPLQEDGRHLRWLAPQDQPRSVGAQAGSHTK